MLSGAWTDFQKLWGIFKAVLETKRCFQLTFHVNFCFPKKLFHVCFSKNVECLAVNSGKLIKKKVFEDF